VLLFPFLITGEVAVADVLSHLELRPLIPLPSFWPIFIWFIFNSET